MTFIEVLLLLFWFFLMYFFLFYFFFGWLGFLFFSCGIAAPPPPLPLATCGPLDAAPQGIRGQASVMDDIEEWLCADVVSPS